MKITRLKRRYCHYDDKKEFCRYKLKDIHFSLKNRKQSYLTSAGILDGSHTYTGPTVVQIDVTNRCNNNCMVCWLRSPLLEELEATSEWQSKELPLKVVIKLLDELHSMGTQRIFFAGGGEPFIHPDIIKIIEHAASKKFECHFNTNFTLIDRDLIKRLISLSSTHIHLNVSLWAASADTYIKTHPNKSADMFHNIVDILKFFSETKTVRHVPHINIYNVLSKLNYKEVYDIVKLAYDVQADSVQFVPMDPVANKTEHLLLNKEEKEHVLKQLKEAKDFLDNDLKNKAGSNLFICEYDQIVRRLLSNDAPSGEYDVANSDMPCYVGWEFARVAANGDVYFCLKSSNMSIGNILNQDFKSIWNSKVHNELRHKAKCFKNTDPFFRQVGCHKTCDNMWINNNAQDRINSLNLMDRFLICGIRLLTTRKS